MSENLARKYEEDNELAEGSSKTARPFIKWVGGKTQLLPELTKRFPKKIGRYFEPFIGGGALFFSVQPSVAYISDINPELINAYQIVRDDVETLITDLKKHMYEEKYYYKIRDLDRSSDYVNLSPVEKASRIIFLNKSCYNGLYRVNSKGQFNTPFGRYTNPTILDSVNLRACSKSLRNVTIKLAEFDAFEQEITTNDFVYFDPPYVPLSTTAYFTSYSSEGFGIEMQQSLFELCRRLDLRGIRFMLSNSSATFVKELYKQFKIDLVGASRAINSKGSKRGQIDEVIVTNY